MPLIEEIKKLGEFVTGVGRPRLHDLDALVRPRKPQIFRFRDDGETPNNPRLAFIRYRTPIRLDPRFDTAAVFEMLFARHGWASSWRDGIFPYLHFHTGTHEVLGIARGHARVRFGGRSGRVLSLRAGDVVVLPAGTGHRRLGASRDLLVVGAYPKGGSYDEPRPPEIDQDEARAAIAHVPVPTQDPVYGRDGPLLRLWRRTSVKE